MSPESLRRQDWSDPPDPSETPLRPSSPLRPFETTSEEDTPDPREPLPLDEEGYATTYGTRQIYCIWSYSDGQRCRGIARKGTRLCYWHDPETEEERHTGFIKTRPVKQPRPITTEVGPLATEVDVDALIQKVARYLAKDEQPDVGRAHALTNVAKHLLKSFELDELRAQLVHAQTHLRRLKNRRKPRKRHLRKAVETTENEAIEAVQDPLPGTRLIQEDSNN